MVKSTASGAANGGAADTGQSSVDLMTAPADRLEVGDVLGPLPVVRGAAGTYAKGVQQQRPADEAAVAAILARLTQAERIAAERADEAKQLQARRADVAELRATLMHGMLLMRAMNMALGQLVGCGLPPYDSTPVLDVTTGRYIGRAYAPGWVIEFVLSEQDFDPDTDSLDTDPPVAMKITDSADRSLLFIMGQEGFCCEIGWRAACHLMTRGPKGDGDRNMPPHLCDDRATQHCDCARRRVATPSSRIVPVW